MKIETKNFASTAELAAVWGITRPGAVKRAGALGIPSAAVKGRGRGGNFRVYPLETMPVDIAAKIKTARSISTQEGIISGKYFPPESIRHAEDILTLVEKKRRYCREHADSADVLESFENAYNSGGIDGEILGRLGKRSIRRILRWEAELEDAEFNKRNILESFLPASPDARRWVSFPEKIREKALDRMKLIDYIEKYLQSLSAWSDVWKNRTKLIEQYVARYNKGQVDKELLSRLGKRDFRSVQRWMKTVYDARRRHEDETAALIPLYGKRRGQTKLTEIEQKAVKNIYLTGSADNEGKKAGLISTGQNRLNNKHVYKLMIEYLMSNGLQAQASGASYPTICRFIARIPYMLKVAFREGEKPFDDKVMPHMEIDYSSEAMLAGDWFTSDGHTLNLFCRNADGNFVRPTLDAFMDKACRKLMGFEVAETESSELVAKALYRSIADNEYILPLNVHIDNGKAYKNKQSRGDFENELEGYYSRLGIKPHFAIPYNAKAKQIERFWRTVDEYFSKMFDTYCGRNIDDKPEILTELMKKAKAHPELVPTMDEVRDRFKKEFMTWYNDKVHTGHGMDGRTPNERWAEEAEDFRVIEPEKLRIALMPRYVKTVRRNGIQYLGYYYRDAEMKTALIQKQKVEIAVDADDITKILVFDRDGQFLFSADRKERSRFADEPDVKTIEAYKANQREERQIRKLKSQVMGLEGKRSAKRNIIIAEPVREELEAKQDVQKKLKGPLDID